MRANRFEPRYKRSWDGKCARRRSDAHGGSHEATLCDGGRIHRSDVRKRWRYSAGAADGFLAARRAGCCIVSPPSSNSPLADSGIAPVTRRNANTRAYLLLKQAVLSGSFRPAQVITLRMMTEFLGLGEMLRGGVPKCLLSEGAFTAMPNRSARVPALDRREIAQLCEL